MSHVDQFESAFRSAIRPTYEPHSVTFKKGLLVADLAPSGAESLKNQVKQYLSAFDSSADAFHWHCLHKDSFDSTGTLLEAVEAQQPDLVCTYRNLDTEDWRFKNSIGSRLDTLINRSAIPVLVIPHPSASSRPLRLEPNQTVIAVTDHLTEDHQLIDFSAAFVDRPGKLVLVHVEDQYTFDRYLAAISRITTIDTDHAREQLTLQLLREPHVFIESCRNRLSALAPQISVHEIIEFGTGIDRFRHHIENQNANLLVLKGTDHNQPGIHGLAQQLINETRQIPVLVI